MKTFIPALVSGGWGESGETETSGLSRWGWSCLVSFPSVCPSDSDWGIRLGHTIFRGTRDASSDRGGRLRLRRTRRHRLPELLLRAEGPARRGDRIEGERSRGGACQVEAAGRGSG